MSARENVSKTDVYAVCEDLMRNGTWVTNAAVHKELGRGSMVTINKYTKAWQTEYVDHLAANSQEQQSDLPQDLLDAAQALYKISLQHARVALEQDYAVRDQALAAERTRVENIRLEAQVQLEDAQRDAASQREAARVYKRLLEDERAKVGALEQALQESERNLALALQQKEQQEHALMTLTAEYEALSRKSADDLATERARSEAVERRYLSRIEDESARAREDRHRALQLDRELKTVNARLERLAEHLIERDRALTDAHAQVAGHEVTIAGLTRDLAQLSHKCDQQAHRYDQQTEALQQAKRLLSEHTGALKARDEELGRLRTDLGEQTQRANQAVAELGNILRKSLQQKRAAKPQKKG